MKTSYRTFDLMVEHRALDQRPPVRECHCGMEWSVLDADQFIETAATSASYTQAIVELVQAWDKKEAGLSAGLLHVSALRPQLAPVFIVGLVEA